MPHEWEERDDEVAAGAICPMTDCGAFGATYVVRGDHIEPREFVCGRCSIEFVVPEDELIFQSVPKDGLLAKVHLA